MRYVLKSSADLSAEEIAAWKGLQSQRADFASPYFSTDFLSAVSAVTASARVLIIENAGRPVGFLPHHRRVGGLGTPIGSHLCDIHGLVANDLPDLDVQALMRAADLAVLPWRHAPIGQPALGAGRVCHHAFYIVDLAQGLSAYEASRKVFAKSAMRAIRVRREKAEKDIGPVSHRFWELDPARLKRLMDWKTEQFRATRQPNIFAHAWVKDLLHTLHSERTGALKGQLSCLYFGEELAAAHFGLRTRDVLHYWFPGYDPKFSELSPGNILLNMMIEAAAGEGCRAVHLGPGEYRYKLEFANASIPVTSGIVYGDSLSGRAAMTVGRVLRGVERVLPPHLSELPTRAIRRLDRHLAFQV